jgi:hypothetical protein
MGTLLDIARVLAQVDQAAPVRPKDDPSDIASRARPNRSQRRAARAKKRQKG